MTDCQVAVTAMAAVAAVFATLAMLSARRWCPLKAAMWLGVTAAVTLIAAQVWDGAVLYALALVVGAITRILYKLSGC